MTSAETATIIRDLPAPLQLGAATVTQREYAALRVRHGEHAGIAYCLTRGAPMLDIVERMLLPHLPDEPLPPAEVWDRLLRSTALVGRVGLVRRAIGLLDVALVDLAARAAGVPVWQALGQPDAPRETMLVAAYPLAGEDAAVTAERVLAAADAGWSLLKISRTPDNDRMRAILDILRAELPADARLVIDASYGWRDADAALDDLREWGEIDLAWLEDPLLPEDVAGCARLRRDSGQPIGVGDEVTDPDLLRRLVEHDAADVIRLDVIAIGGLTPAAEVLGWATERGVRVSAHVYPEISVHLGAGVETFDRTGNPYDPAPTLFTTDTRFEPGLTTPSSAPGLGCTFTTDPFTFGGRDD